MKISHIRAWGAYLQLLLFALVLGLEMMAWIAALLFFSGLSLDPVRKPALVPSHLQTLYVLGLYGFILLNIYLMQRWRGDPERLPGIGSKFPGVVPLMENNPSRKWMKEGSSWYLLLISGWLAGIGILFFQYLLQFRFGWMHWQGVSAPLSPLLLNIPMALAFSFLEELLFRGWILNVFLEKHRHWKALCWQALLFSLAHFLALDSPDSWGFAFIGLFLIGILWGLLRLRTGNIWISIGMHASWIYLISATSQIRCFSFQADRLYLTGGYYPVSGILGLGLLLVLLLWVITRGHHYIWKFWHSVID